MPSAGLPEVVTIRPHMSSSSQTECACYKKWNGKPRLECVDGRLHLRKLLWVHCSRYAVVKGNDRADRLAGKATLTRYEVLRSLRHYLRAQNQGHHTVDRLEERGVERGSARRCSFKGRERAIVSQTNIGTVSKATSGKLLRHGVERIWAFPSACIYIYIYIYHLELN